MVEGIGDHGCEYMTGGRVLVLGRTGRNFAAGMSGGIAWVYDEDGAFASRCNTELVALEPLAADIEEADAGPRPARAPPGADGERPRGGPARRAGTTSVRRFVRSCRTTTAACSRRRHGCGRRGWTRRRQPRWPPSRRTPATWRGWAAPDGQAHRASSSFARRSAPGRPPLERIRDWSEEHPHLDDGELGQQAARCMDCGVPFCHTGVLISGMASGCPINNLIPEWNDLVYRGQWQEAIDPPAPDQQLPGVHGAGLPRTLRGLLHRGPRTATRSRSRRSSRRSRTAPGPRAGSGRSPPLTRTGRTVAVVGSGPAGLAAADQLNRAGHLVTVYERAGRIGGLLMYGIPNMKLDKDVVARRTGLMAEEGVRFVTGVTVGADISAERLLADHDAVVLATGSTLARDLAVPGRELGGIHLAMSFLRGNTRRLLDGGAEAGAPIDAAGRDVVVIGGGDTGTDCVGTAIRQGARSVRQLEIMPGPPETRAADNPWPEWPKVYSWTTGRRRRRRCGARTRGATRRPRAGSSAATSTSTGIEIADISWGPRGRGGGCAARDARGPGTSQVLPADLVLLALGFTGPEAALPRAFGCELDPRGNVRTGADRMTTVPGVFAAGDCVRGQSLVVWAIREGRMAAQGVDRFLMRGETVLPG